MCQQLECNYKAVFDLLFISVQGNIVSYIPGTFLFVSLKIYYFAFTRIHQLNHQ